MAKETNGFGTRKIDDLGRIILPKEIREALGLSEDSNMKVTLEGEVIILEKADPPCEKCGR
ncbi:MAG: AbrB/MazE/SpoVT family DNA-binding domain-containing protein [Defluviitaleaceae bacterium]|nr:AbrB/MazE/SpoVT family DNA-binding domain-containing protein [Defluviitaleaceae bacterium]